MSAAGCPQPQHPCAAGGAAAADRAARHQPSTLDSASKRLPLAGWRSRRSSLNIPEDDPGPPCSGKLSAAPAYSAIPVLWSPEFAGLLAICSDQCAPTQITIRRSCFATTIRLLLALFFSPVGWPLVILLLPGVTLLSCWIAEEAPKSVLAAPEAAHRKPSELVEAWQAKSPVLGLRPFAFV